MKALTGMALCLLLIVALQLPLAAATDAGTDAAAAETLSRTAAPPALDTSILAATGTATADGPVGGGGDLVATGGLLVQLIMAKEWKLVASAGLMLLLAGLRSVWNYVPKGWRPAAVILSGAVATTASGLALGAGTWDAIWNGVSTAGLAAALYDLLRVPLSKIPGIGKVFESRTTSDNDTAS